MTLNTLNTHTDMQKTVIKYCVLGKKLQESCKFSRSVCKSRVCSRNYRQFVSWRCAEENRSNSRVARSVFRNRHGYSGLHHFGLNARSVYFFTRPMIFFLSSRICCRGNGLSFQSGEKNHQPRQFGYIKFNRHFIRIVNAFSIWNTRTRFWLKRKKVAL